LNSLYLPVLLSILVTASLSVVTFITHVSPPGRPAHNAYIHKNQFPRPRKKISVKRSPLVMLVTLCIRGFAMTTYSQG
jgi:hypothetical protein